MTTQTKRWMNIISISLILLWVIAFILLERQQKPKCKCMTEVVLNT